MEKFRKQREAQFLGKEGGAILTYYMFSSILISIMNDLNI